MTENGEEAKELAGKAGKQAKQSGRQARASARNAGRAAKAGAEAAADTVADEARDAAEKVEGTVDDAVDAARRIDVGVLGRMSSDTGVGFLALSVSIYAGLIAYTKFRQAASGRSHIVS